MESRSWSKVFLVDLLRRISASPRASGPPGQVPSLRLGAGARRASRGLAFEVVCLVDKDAKGGWKSRRGESEIKESMRMALIQERFPEKSWRYVLARGLLSYESGWVEAARYAGISPREVDSWMGEGKGERALEEHWRKAKAANIRSPAILIDGRPLDSALSVTALVEAVNMRLAKGQRIPLGPEAPEIMARLVPRLWILIDSGEPLGKENSHITSGIRARFPTISPKVWLWNSFKAQEKFKELNVRFLPAYIMEDNKGARKVFKAAIDAKWIIPKKGYLVVAPKGRNGIWTNRAGSAPNRLDLFVMTQCPFSVKAEEALMEAMKKGLLRPQPEIVFHQIASFSKAVPHKKGEFTSMHGKSEWEEGVRQLIIQKYHPDNLWTYLAERNKNLRSPDWKSAAKRSGIDPQEVLSAFEEGKTLLARDVELAEELGISSSPTFLWQNRFVAVGVKGLTLLPGFENVPVDVSGAGSCNK